MSAPLARIRQLALTLSIFFASVHQATARPWGDLVPSQLKDMPRWPLYAAALVAITIGIAKTIQYFRGSQPKTKIFPKLTLRRRLYAPYSGGNHAEVGFDKRDA